MIFHRQGNILSGFFISDDNKYAIILPETINLTPVDNGRFSTGNLPYFYILGPGGDIWNYTGYRNSVGDTNDCITQINNWQNDNSPHQEIYYYQSTGNANLNPAVSSFTLNNLFAPHIGQLFLLDDFYTNLYPELLDNEETKLSLQDWIDDDGTQRWDTLTDKDLKAMELIEKYNKNVLLLRSTRKVQASVTGSITSSSSGDSSVNLSGIENKLQSISDKLQTTEIIDNSQKSITDVLNQQANTIQVDEIGLLRSKKGYY